jgi:hypothetical protein
VGSRRCRQAGNRKVTPTTDEVRTHFEAVFGVRLTMPSPATKLTFIWLPLWGPNGHDKRNGPRESRLSF